MFDHKIILSGNNNQPDLFDTANKAITLSSLLRKRDQEKDQYDQEQAVKKAYANGLIKNQNGEISFDKNKTLSSLAEVNPREYFAAQESFNKSNYESQKAAQAKAVNDLDLTARLAGSAVDQSTYDMAISKGKELGLDVSKMPQQYDPRYVRYIQGAALTSKEKIEQQLKEQQFAYSQVKDKQDFSLRKSELSNRALDRKEARDERRFQSGVKADEKEQALVTPYGLANTVDDAKQLKEAHESKQSFDNKINQMIALRTKNNGGAMFNREDVQRAKQLSKDALLEYKNMAKLGVLSKSDEDIINAIIPEDPLEYNSPLAAIQGQDPILARLKAFKSDNDADFQSRIATRTRAGVKTAAEPKMPMQQVAPEAQQAQVFKTNQIEWAD